jgi:hypothetical protein
MTSCYRPAAEGWLQHTSFGCDSGKSTTQRKTGRERRHLTAQAQVEVEERAQMKSFTSQFFDARRLQLDMSVFASPSGEPF